jgi:hypothetical protein
MKSWTNEKLQRVLAEVAQRSAIDPEFRALALLDATSAIARINPNALPNDLIFKFVDNSGTTKTIPLPDPVIDACDELLDDELEKVAGGGDPPPPPLVGG